MDKIIVRILKNHGFGYMADDHKEMIEEIEAYVIKRENQKQTIKTIMQLDEESGLYKN